MTEPRLINLRSPAVCAGCETLLVKGARAWWYRASREVRCGNCERIPPAAGAEPSQAAPPPAPPASGAAGASAQREYERRHNRREARILSEHPRIGRVLHRLSSDPQSTQAWAQGAKGERILGEHLDACAAPTVIVLHDLRVPGSSANIDHIVITPSRVFVIDAKRYSGKVRTRNHGGLRHPDIRLSVAGRDRSTLVRAALAQADLVAATITGAVPGLQVTPVLCFVGADWPLLGKPLDIDGVVVTWPKALASMVRRHADGPEVRTHRLARAVARVLRPAS